MHDIIEIEKPTNTPYFILETLSKDNDLPQGLYVVHIISDEPIKLVTFYLICECLFLLKC